MRIEQSAPPAPIATPPRPERGASIDVLGDRAPSSPRVRSSPLLNHLATHGQESSLPAEDVESLLQLAAHQETLFLEKKHQQMRDALCDSPWAALADADPENPQARQVMQEARGYLAELLPAEEIEAAEQRAGGSHSDFFKEIAALIGRLEGSWINKYSALLGGYVQVYTELTDKLKVLREHLGTPDKDGNISVDFTTLRDSLKLLRTTWMKEGFGEIFDSKKAAEDFLAELGIEGLTVVNRKDGKGWQIGIHESLIGSLISIFPSGSGKISASALNELMAQKEVMMERFNFINRAIPEKYQRQLQMWDALVKLLSSTIDAVTEADRSVIQAMAG